MRGKSLESLLDDLRAEAHISLNPAQNVQARPAQVKLLQRTQEWLWSDFAWPHLYIERQYPVSAGQRFYDFGADFDLERIGAVRFKDGGAWCKLQPGITSEDYLAWDSDLDQRSWPIRRWRISENDQIEVWPVSDRDSDPTTFEGCIKVEGIRRLKPFVNDADLADLDDRLIVLYAASELLGGRGAKDGSIKLSLANKHYAKLRGRLTKSTSFSMFGIGGHAAPRRPFVSHYRPPYPTSS